MSLSLFSIFHYSSCCIFFFFSLYGDHRDLHSFPTRRSSDLQRRTLRRRRLGHRDVIQHRPERVQGQALEFQAAEDRKSTRLNSSHTVISYAVFCLKKKKKTIRHINAATHMIKEYQKITLQNA